MLDVVANTRAFDELDQCHHTIHANGQPANILLALPRARCEPAPITSVCCLRNTSCREIY